MCGIAGFFQPIGLGGSAAEPKLHKMMASLAHRGPDDSGDWVDADAGIALGHRRLSVLDLTSSGHQPMRSASGRYIFVFNGEIYNHLEVRKELETSGSAVAWQGHSDTEILLAGFDHWGIEATLRKSVGMFAFALWDRDERTLTLARDRIGEKPLYYGWQRDTLLFGSELKALRAHPLFNAHIDRSVLADYFRRGYIAAPHSIYEGVFKLLPGCYVQFSGAGNVAPMPREYWSLQEIAERGQAQPFGGSAAEAVERLDFELRRAVAGQCIADVPLGAFLSGGIDSSSIVALMQVQSARPVKTFTIGFHESGFNEADHARAVAHHLGTHHTELVVTAREAMEVIPRLASIYDEPFGDSSAIPTYLVSQLARQSVTVSLSGDGGDELFGGYERYQRTLDIWSLTRRVPYFLRKGAALGAAAFARPGRQSSGREAAIRVSRYLCAQNASAVYQTQMTQCHDAQRLVMAGDGLRAEFAVYPVFALGDPYSEMMYADTLTYLPDDILVKVDRASMAVALEARVPMLDHRVVEFAWQLPLSMKVRGQTRKWLLKQVLARYLPQSLIERPKMGFGVPVGEWVRGPLREWAESLLCENRLRSEGLLNPKVARGRWLRHLSVASAGGDTIWHMLMFQSWLASVPSG
jgi:asparagine synthase (glutamine-hydrolysing)